MKQVPKPSVWSGQRVLVTGHTGFKGTWLSLWLQQLGASVVGLSLPPATAPSMFEVTGAANGLTSHYVDVTNFKEVRDVVGDARPDVVFHMAAQSLVRESYVHPIETFQTNVMGTVNVLEAVRLANCARATICVTSDKCYANQEWDWGYREIEPLGGEDPYSSSKACAELVTHAYQRSFFEGRSARDVGVAATVRAGNVIGGGDWAPDRLVPDIIRAAVAQQRVMLRNPTAMRPWQHVLEPLCGYLLLAERLLEGAQLTGGWNFGPADSEARTVLSLLEGVGARWPEPLVWDLDEEQSAPEAHTLRLDSSKAITHLGWAPRWTFETALDHTVTWYRAFYRGEDVRDLTCRQLELYTGDPS